MQNVHLICIFIFCGLLIGCTEPSKTLDATSDTFPSISAEMPTISPYPTASPTAFPTQTSLPTATFTPNPTITPKVEIHDIYFEEILDKSDLQGNLIGRDKLFTRQELFTLPQWNRITLPGNDPLFTPLRLSFVSPDWRKLAYQDYTPEKNIDIRIITGDAIDVSESSWSEVGNWDIISWLDNQQLALAENSHRDGTVFIYDSSNGEVSELKPFFPVTTEKGIIAPIGTLAVPYVYYDPTLTRLVIVRYENDQPLTNYELWDVTNQTLLWEASGLSLDSSRPVWSPNGRSFALSLMPNPPDEELYCSELLLVGYDGEQFLIDDCVGSGLSWSPEGQFLAVWKVGHGDICPIPYDTTQLLVIEVETGGRDIFTLCESREGGIFLSQYPIWSPDGRFIAFNTFDTSRSSTGAIILDRVQWRAYDLPDLAEINGWIKSNP